MTVSDVDLRHLHSSWCPQRYLRNSAKSGCRFKSCLRWVGTRQVHHARGFVKSGFHVVIAYLHTGSVSTTLILFIYLFI